MQLYFTVAEKKIEKATTLYFFLPFRKKKNFFALVFFPNSIK